MIDSPERAALEAESWLASARDKLAALENGEAQANVCCALAIHAIIRANDAVTLRFLRIKATRHDDAPALFGKLLEQGKVTGENKRFLRLLQRMAVDKSGADYGKSVFSRKDAQAYVQDAEEFVEEAKRLIK